MPKVVEPHFYRNPKGVVGLSIDEGLTLMLPSGKVLPIRHDVWDFDLDEPEDELAPKQREYLDRYRKKQDEATPIDELAWKLRRKRHSLDRTFEIDLQDESPRKAQDVTLAVSSDPDD